MKPIYRNVLAVIVGWLVGVVVNSSIVQLGMGTYPENVDINNMESLGNFLKDAGAIYFVYPFLAHAIGTLIGAFVAALISKNRKYGTALIIGGLFFIGGAIMVFMLPAPAWFESLDLIVAYFPMALLGAFLAKSLRRKK
ncbi:MAG: hypothetical protein Crog4KO_24780 [Crocinitomicaceae bacterium]